MSIIDNDDIWRVEERLILSPRELKLPLPLPKAFGVYVISVGELVELEPLPIRVRVPRVRLSAEITQPSKATISGDKPKFLVYRRDPAGSAPQTAPVRVVARVSRMMKRVSRMMNSLMGYRK